MSSGTNNSPESNDRPFAARDGCASIPSKCAAGRDPVQASLREKAGGERRESILVHACCASCSSYVLAHLAERYTVTAYYYNPNIQPEEEYKLRLEEMRRVCEELGVPLLEGPYDTKGWWQQIEPYRELPERSERCWNCYGFRLEETARKAKELGFALITTTLSVSPHKAHRCIVSEGEAAAGRHGVRFLGEDFKKRDGFKISIERSRELHLTRQDYCGCLLSLEERRSRDLNNPSN
jgi:predicted adenine nucleotide alpha hydrolase (AANH) superfamily ATPase